MNNPLSREDIVGSVKEQSDIVQIVGGHVDLKKSGSRYLGLCPFHGEKTPSFTVNPGSQRFHCFGCGESGDVLSFMMKYHNLDFPDALKELAGRCNIALPEKRMSRQEKEAEQRKKVLYEVHERATTLYETYLQESREAEVAREYLKKRGISEEIRQKFRLGYAPSVEVEGWNFLGSRLPRREQQAGIESGLLVLKDRGGTYDRFRDRILFPITDISGRICGFGGRIVGDGKPKYLNSPESPIFNKGKLLLGLYQQKDEIRKRDSALLVEGNFDLLSLVAGGIPQVVAPLGTAVTREQIRLLKRFASTTTLLFDGDSAGVKAAVRAAPLFLKEQVTARIIMLPSDHDPDTYIRQEGSAKLVELLENASSLPEFLFSYWEKLYGTDLEGKTQIAEELKGLVAAAPSPLQRTVLISHFSEKLGMENAGLENLLKGPSIEEPPLPPPPVQQQAVAVEVKPLNFAERQMVGFMVMQPDCFASLHTAGIREYLKGTIGEILFLELKSLLEDNPEAEPEDLLPRLEEGEERRFVSSLLLNPPEHQGDVDEKEELGELLDHLEKHQMKQRVTQIRQEIVAAQNAGDMAQLTELMAENLRIERRLHSDRNKKP